MFKIINFVIIATFIGQLLNFFTDVLIANAFGTSWKADSYFLSLLIPTIICDSFAVLISSVFIPLFMSRKKSGDENSFFSTVTNLAVITTICLCMIIFFAVPAFINFIASGFSSQAREVTILLTRLLLFLIVVKPIISISSNLLNSYNYFTVPALEKVFTFTGVVFSIYFFKEIFDVYSLVLGFFIGTVGFLLIQSLWVKRCGVNYSASIYLSHPALKEMMVLISPIILASLFNYLNIFIERSIAAGFSEGSIASLNYAFRVLNVPVNALILPALTVILPKLSKYAVEGDMIGIEKDTLRGMKFVSFIMIPIIAIMIVVRIPLIKVLFERGEFTAQSTEITATAFLFYASGIFGVSIVALLSRVFYAFKDMKMLSLIGIVMIVLNIFLIVILSKKLGFIGIPLTFSITSLIHMVTIIAVLEKRRMLKLSSHFLRGSIKHLLSAGVMILACLYLSQIKSLYLLSGIALIYQLFLTAIIGISAYSLTSLVLKVNEIEFIIDKVKIFGKRFSGGIIH